MSIKDYVSSVQALTASKAGELIAGASLCGVSALTGLAGGAFLYLYANDPRPLHVITETVKKGASKS